MEGPLGVLIPTCARHALLDRAIAACAGWPVRVVNDSGGPLARPGVAMTHTPGGLGFARAVNAGLVDAEAEGWAWVLLLNDDAAPEPGCLEALAGAIHPGLGAAGPLLVGPAGLESAGLRWSPTTARLRQRLDAPAAPRRVDALSGACLLLRAQERLDPGFRHGFEDVALCLALRARGLEVLLLPQARCWHAGGATLHRRSPEATRHALSGHLRLIGPDPARRALALAWAAAQVLREGPTPSRLRALAQGWAEGRAPCDRPVM